MKNPHMLYRCPGPEVFEGVACETIVVEEEDVEAAKAEGWHLDWMQAKAAYDEAAGKLHANEQELAEIAQKLEAAGEPVPSASGRRAVHKGRGVWAVLEADGSEVETGLTKEAALAKAAG